MPDDQKKVSLSQVGVGEDHAAKVIREKLGVDWKPQSQPMEQPVPAGESLEERVIAAIRTVFDPEIPLNVYDLGLIYHLDIEPTNAVKVQMTLTAPGCPVAGDILAEVKRKVEAIPDVPRAEVELVWDPPWTRERLSEAAKLELGLL